jgi:CubicO group peptidase (beta-lactamase class C family)
VTLSSSFSVTKLSLGQTAWPPTSGDGYGYGWFLRTIGGEEVKFGWGYGGQMLYIAPSLGLTVVMTSDENSPSARTGYRDDLHALLAEIIGAVRSA